MSWQGYAQIVLYFVLLVALVKPLGGYMARVYEGERTIMSRVFAPLERVVYRLAGTNPEENRP